MYPRLINSSGGIRNVGYETLWGTKNVSFARGHFDTLIDENVLQGVYIIAADITYSQEFDTAVAGQNVLATPTVIAAVTS